MVIDGLAPCAARLSANIELPMQNEGGGGGLSSTRYYNYLRHPRAEKWKDNAFISFPKKKINKESNTYLTLVAKPAVGACARVFVGTKSLRACPTIHTRTAQTFVDIWRMENEYSPETVYYSETCL